MLVVPSKTLCGVTTETGCIYTEIIIKKENNNMNKIIKSGEVMKLKDLISYEDGSITNIDVVSNDTMKFVLWHSMRAPVSHRIARLEMQ